MTNDTPDNAPIQIPLTKGYTAIVSPEDIDLLNFKWYAETKQGVWKTQYARRSISNGDNVKRKEFMHRAVMRRVMGRDLLSSEFIDHINGDGLDNRRENLRLASHTENNQNRRINRNNTSGYKGVYWNKNEGKWRARIMAHGKRHVLGQFVSIIDAAKAYNDAALKYYGEFADLNIIP